MTHPKPRAPIVLILALLCVAAVRAETPASECPADTASSTSPRAIGLPVSLTEAPIHASADLLRVETEGVILLEGQVRVEQGARVLEADTAVWNPGDATLTLEGDARLAAGPLEIRTPRALLEVDRERALFPDAEYRLIDGELRGRAERIDILDRNRAVLRDATLTSCPPSREDWVLGADRVKLDRARGRGTARHALLRFGGIPLLYTPWIDFPLDDRRQTGFLYPDLGYSSQGGIEFAAPWYWNIAPNYDATLTPRVYGARGVQLGSEFRYLHRRNRGQVRFDYLDSDALYGDRSRWFATLRHDGNPLPGVTTRLYLNDVSDPDYFGDFGRSFALTSTTHLERLGEIAYRARHGRVLLRVQNFLTIDETIPAASRPYQRLPQLVFDLNPARMLGLTWRLHGEWVDWWRENSVTGTRLDLTPSVSLPLQRPWGFLRPELGWRYTRYDLDNRAPGEPTRITRELPFYSLDAGLYFDRFSAGARQTLEPRIYYLYKPWRDQDAIPLFDTGRPAFGLGQMFRNERFTGVDRVGDANQLTLALTSRWIAGGRERARATAGIIRYFADRRVTLPGEAPETGTLSDAAFEAQLAPHPHWRASLSLLWNPERSRTERSSFGVQYRRDDQRVVNFGYRYDRDNFEQTDLSAAWRLTPDWLALARWNHSLRDGSDIETLVGLEYGSCCWKLRLVARRFVGTTPGEYNTGYLVQLVLRGMGAIGDQLNRNLAREIPGFRLHD